MSLVKWQFSKSFPAVKLRFLVPKMVAGFLCVLLGYMSQPLLAMPYQQDGQGLAVVEAESFASNVAGSGGHQWQSASSAFPGFSGVDALQALPADGAFYGSGYAGGASPQLDLSINFVATGTHYVWVRALGPAGTSNALHIGLDGQDQSTAKNLKIPVGGYEWVTNQAGFEGGGRVMLSVPSVGEHTVNVWMREAGVIIDKVVVTTDPNYNPSQVNGGLGPDESAQGGGQPGTADLAVALSVNNTTPAEGEQVQYTVLLSNQGPEAATNVTAQMVLPVGLSYQSDDAASTTTFYDSGTGIWTIGGMASGEALSLTVVAEVDAGTAGTQLNTDASVAGANEPDPASGNNNASASLTVAGGSSSGGAYQQDGQGLAVVEAESFSANLAGNGGHQWQSAGAGFPGYSGVDALQAFPADGTNYINNYAGGNSPQLDLTINFVATGTHYVWVRALGPAGTSNALHIGLDGQDQSTAKNLKIPVGGYEWVTNQAGFEGGGRVMLSVPSVGEHTVNVWMREAGVIIDKVVVTTDPNYNPSQVNGGLGPDESAQGGGQPGTADLAVALSVNNTTPAEGEQVQYTVLLSNQGPEAATNVTAQMVLPVGLSYQSDDAASTTTFYDSGTGIWTIGGMASGEALSLTVVAEVDAGTAGTQLNTDASVAGANEPDPASGNNIVSASLTVAGGSSSGGAYQQDGQGLAVVEAESFSANLAGNGGHQWQSAGAGFPGYSGVDALQAFPADGTNYINNYAGGNSPQLDLTINFVATGTHYVWVRALGPAGTSNALHIGLDGQDQSTAKNLKIPVGGYEWVTNQAGFEGGGRVMLSVPSVGEHTVNVWMREAGVIIDKVVVTTDPNYNPSQVNGGLGPDESAQGGGQPGTNADLAVDLFTDNSEPAEGQTFTLTAAVANQGPGNATGVTLQVSIPNGLSYVSDNAAANGSSYNASTGLWTVGSLANAGSRSVDIIVSVDPGSAGSVVDTSVNIASANEPDPFAADNAANQTISVAGSSGSSGGAYLQDALGLAVVEAESFSANLAGNGGHQWQSAGAGFPGYSGVDALQAFPADGTNYINNYAGGNSPQLDLTINFVATGTHYVWVRALGPAGTSNALHIGLDGQDQSTAKNLKIPVGGYEWVTNQAGFEGGGRVMLSVPSVGEHTVNVWMREAGVIIDKVVVTTDPNYNPSQVNGGFGPDESATADDNQAAAPIISPGQGIFYDSAAISISTTTPGATIFYTLDGSDPIASGTPYTGPFFIFSTATINAAAIASGKADSETSSALVKVIPLPDGVASHISFNETSGATFADTITGLVASCTDCPASVAGQIEEARNFDGISDEVSFPDNDTSFDWSTGQRFSIEFWMNKSSACLGREAVVGRTSDSSQLRWWIGCENDVATFELTDTAGNTLLLAGSSDITNGQWHHIVAVQDAVSGENRLYVDGILEAIGSSSYTAGFQADSALNIGWLDDSFDDYHFAGAIDELAIHHRVLSERQIKRHHLDGTVGIKQGVLGCSKTIDIMPLGDSITRRNGYRAPLWYALADAGYDVNYVGSKADSQPGDYDHDHQGHSGWTTSQMASSLPTFLDWNPPDVVLLHLGTNEDTVYPYPSVAGVEDLHNIIDAHNLDTSIVQAKIINRMTYLPEVTQFNNNIESQVLARVNNGDKILLVDHESALNYVDDMEDEKHPNQSGYDKMAQVWFDGLSSFLPACVPTSPGINSTSMPDASDGVPYTYNVPVIGYPVADFSLVSGPAGLSIHPDTGELRWPSPVSGVYTIEMSLSNTEGASQEVLSLTVN